MRNATDYSTADTNASSHIPLSSINVPLILDLPQSQLNLNATALAVSKALYYVTSFPFSTLHQHEIIPIKVVSSALFLNASLSNRLLNAVILFALILS